MSVDFSDIIEAYLHDPPDKALDIRGHEKRAAELATLALSRDVSPQKIREWTRVEDVQAAITQRVPMPTAGADGERAIDAREEEEILLVHPLSGSEKIVSVRDAKKVDVKAALENLLRGVDAPEKRFLLIWRAFQDELAKKDEAFFTLPADTRIPDHSIWNHLETAAAWKAAVSTGQGAALLSFHLGPVQSFIVAARSLRDLWTGSYLLSWLVFKAMEPLIDLFGPQVFIYPYLRSAPLLDYFLVKRHGLNRITPPDRDMLRTPCLPNRFLALVPDGGEEMTARDFAKKCEDSCRKEWKEISDAVRAFLDHSLRELDQDWARLWDSQIDSFFEIRTAILPLRQKGGNVDEVIAKFLSRDGKFESALPEAYRIRRLAEAIPKEDRPKYGQDSAGRWSGQVELSARLLAAYRSVGHIPLYRLGDEEVPQKCSILGTYEQMGPARFNDSSLFWENAASKVFKGSGGVRIRKNERLCAVSLVKRFAWPVYLADEIGHDKDGVSFPDTATVAAGRWLDEAKIDPEKVRREYGSWNGQWLHWQRRDQESDDPIPEDPKHEDPKHEDPKHEDPKHEDLWNLIKDTRKGIGPPPAYYAILKMDGDNMGKWLSGKLGPKLEKCLHPRIRDYYKNLGAGEAAEALGTPRPVTPALHAAISEALSNFATRFVPDIVREHRGELVYAGGDDVLALLPTNAAFPCASNLRETFRRDWENARDGRKYLLMGSLATISGGIAVVHHKEDLRLALKAAADAEEAAKKAGRDALGLAVWRRSGEHVQVVLKWEFEETLSRWTELFIKGASDRWVYKLRQELPVLEGLPLEAVEAEMRRLADRSKEEDGSVRIDPDEILDAFRKYMETTKAFREEKEDFRNKILESFVILLQSASFLARGRDER